MISLACYKEPLSELVRPDCFKFNNSSKLGLANECGNRTLQQQFSFCATTAVLDSFDHIANTGGAKEEAGILPDLKQE